MQPTQFSGAFRLFRVFGISVFLHWTWFVAVAILVQIHASRSGISGGVILLQFIALFTIVVLHEFGHALACRSVGGQADTIVLWPLGGIAFVKPPPRPGPVLWSIAAGPLVNVALIPVTFALAWWQQVPGDIDQWGNLTLGQYLAASVLVVNALLLFFNMLPIYPLDGGQILQALLWFFVGRATSLRITSIIGMAAAGVGGVFAVITANTWYVLMALFIGWQAFNGYRVARYLAREELLHQRYIPPAVPYRSDESI